MIPVRIKQKTQIMCPNCDGSKIDPETNKPCADCGGQGVVSVSQLPLQLM